MGVQFAGGHLLFEEWNGNSIVKVREGAKHQRIRAENVVHMVYFYLRASTPHPQPPAPSHALPARRSGPAVPLFWGNFFINVNVNVAPVPPQFLALLPRIFEGVCAPQGKILTPICTVTETTHWGTILERIGPCLRVISEVKHRPT